MPKMPRLTQIAICLVLAWIAAPAIAGSEPLEDAEVRKLLRAYFPKYSRHFAHIDGRFHYCAEYTGSDNNTGQSPGRVKSVSAKATFISSTGIPTTWPIRFTLIPDEVFARAQAFQKLERGQYGYFYAAKVERIIDEDSMIIGELMVVDPRTPWEYVRALRDAPRRAQVKYRQLKRSRTTATLRSTTSEQFQIAGRRVSLLDIERHMTHEHFKGRMELISRYFPHGDYPDPRPVEEEDDSGGEKKKKTKKGDGEEIDVTQAAIDRLRIDRRIQVDGISTRGLKAGRPWPLARRTQLVLVDDGHAVAGKLFKRGLTLPQFEQLLSERGMTPRQFVELHISAHRDGDRREADAAVLSRLGR